MKRLLSSIAVLLIFFSCSISCFAAEYTGDVYARINYSSASGVYTATSNNGQYVVITDNGIQIMVNSNHSDLVLVVHQIMKNEQNSYEWFESCIPQSVIGFIPYDIYFLNASGERIELSSENTITISISKSAQYVLGLSCEGNIINIPYSINDANITFTASTSSDYYVLCEEAGDIKSPQTGDTSNIYLFVIILFISLICLLLTARKLYSSKSKQ